MPRYVNEVADNHAWLIDTARLRGRGEDES
jgi:hypothetical protein